MQRTMALNLLVYAFALQACGTAANAEISPASTDVWTRSDAIDHIANTACERAAKCLQIGSGQKYATQDDCVTQQRADFNKKWSAESCGDPHGIIEGQLATCEANVEHYSCSNSIFDLAGVLSECGEKDVCR